MSKTDPNSLTARDSSMGLDPAQLAPDPAFDAIRTDDDSRSDLRHNQTVDIPFSFRQELANRELPRLPAEHLRATNDFREPLNGVPPKPEEPEGAGPKPSPATLNVKWTLALLGVLAAAIYGWWRVTMPEESAPVTASGSAGSIVPIESIPSQSPAVTEVHAKAATVAPAVASATPQTEKPAKHIQRKHVEHKHAAPRQSNDSNSNEADDPAALIYKP